MIEIIEGTFLPVAEIKGKIFLIASWALLPIIINNFVLESGVYIMDGKDIEEKHQSDF